MPCFSVWDIQNCGCSTSTPCTACFPCGQPQKNLTLSWNHLTLGDFSGTLTYSSFTNSWNYTGSTGGVTSASFSCSSGSFFFQFNGGACQSPCIDPDFCLTITELTCNPFHVHFAPFDPNSTNNCESGSTSITYLEIDDPDAGTGTESDCPCTNTITIQGCNSLALSGATVTLKDTGGSTLDSGTTDASGHFNSILEGAAGVTIVIAKSRFVTRTLTYQILNCSGGLTLGTGAAATGYHCMTGCADPVSNTLTATFSIAGAKTLTFSGSTWSSSFTASGHSYVVTLATNKTLTITRDGVSCGTASLTVTACPPSFAGSITVPAGSCATELGSTGTLTE